MVRYTPRPAASHEIPVSQIVIFGAYGLLGTPLSSFLTSKDHQVRRQTRGAGGDVSLDPYDADAVTDYLAQTRPDIVVNLIAATNVDACEADVAGAWHANCRSAEVIAAAVGRTGGHLIHISTDHLYDGAGPHAEGSASPCNVYSLTKYAGELAVLPVGATVLRTNFVGRSHVRGRSGLSDWLYGTLAQHQPATVFADILFAPLHVSSLCGIIERAISLRPAGIYNAGSRNGISKADFALEFANRLGLDASCLVVGRSTDIPTRVRRPFDMRMQVERFERDFGFIAPTMSETLDLLARDYLE